MIAPANAPGLVVVVDDDPGQRLMLSRLLEALGHPVELFADGAACLEALTRLAPECLCLDLMMPGISGLEVLRELRPDHPQLPVVLLTADASVESVVEAMRLGAYDYLVKPVERTRFTTVIRNATEHYRMSRRLRELEAAAGEGPLAGIVGSSPAIRALLGQLERVAGSDINVLLAGESGTGKELAARAIHHRSARSAAPYVALNCAAIPGELMESELFGHERGAFTSAVERRIGSVERADGGTLFLDEIGELAPPLQAKLLRVLQERRFTRVGGSTELESDFRLIAATNRNLFGEVRDGRFREDLYFRVAVFEIEIPPLRKRRDDIPLLAAHFLAELTAGAARPPRLAADAIALLERYRWPGNVRELRNAIERAVVICDGDQIRPEHLSRRVREEAARRSGDQPTPGEEAGAPAAGSGLVLPADLALADLERAAIDEALRRTGGNLSRAARLLGIGRTTLYRKLKRYRGASAVSPPTPDLEGANE